MQAHELNRMTMLAEGQEPPELTKKSRARSAVQAEFERLQQSLPPIQAKVSQLAPGLVGLDVADPEATQKLCGEIDDLANRLSQTALALREKVGKYAAVKE